METGASDAERRENMRRFVNERLKRLEENQKLLHESLEMLDRGEPLDAIREHGRAALGERFDRFRDGGPRGPRGGDGPGEFGPPPPGEEHGGELRGPQGRRGSDRRKGSEVESGPRGEERKSLALTEEERSLIIDMLLVTRPGLGERLKQVQTEKPEEFDAMIRRSAPQFLRMIEDKRRDPEAFQVRRSMFETEFATRRIAREIRAEGKEPTEEQVQQLKDAVTKQFEARQKFEEQTIQRMRDQIEKSEERMRAMASDRDVAIERELKKLLEGDRRGPDEAPRKGPPGGDSRP